MHQPTALLVAYLCDRKSDPSYVERAVEELAEIEGRSLGARGVRMLDTGSDLSPLCVSAELLLASAARKKP